MIIYQTLAFAQTPEWLAPVKLSDAGQDQELADDDAGDEVQITPPFALQITPLFVLHDVQKG